MDGVVVEAVDVDFVFKVDLKAAGVGVEDIEAAVVGADPEIAVFVGGEGHEDVAGEALRVGGVVGVMLEFVVHELVEAAALGGDPEAVFVVFEDLLDDIGSEGGGVGGVVAECPESGESRLFLVIEIEPAAGGAEPDTVP